MDTIKDRLKQRSTIVEEWLTSCLRAKTTPAGLKTAMEYSLHAGGKRIRPVLCLSVISLFGKESNHFLPFAGAIECIHTYSLIHDDLPAMDDDDLRRGRPSNHKQFDEATAILAGDGLLTDAFAFMATVPAKAENVLAAIAHVAKAAGSEGMVGGQFLDMQYTGAEDAVFYEQLVTMHAMKTGALLVAPCVCGALLADTTEQDQKNMQIFGSALGAAFQIVDDILDETGTEEELGKPVGSDIKQGKVTYPSLLGLEKSKQLAYEYTEQAIRALSSYSGQHADFLRDLARYIVVRVS